MKKQRLSDLYIQFASQITTYLSSNSMALLSLSEEDLIKYKIKTLRLVFKFI